ncbi:MAG: hypothetical protein R3D70_24305 [Rhizobiaceae bacterium]
MVAIYCIDRLTWRGIGITVEYCPRWLGANAGIQAAHLQVRSDNQTPLPITETGYRSHFMLQPDPLAEFGGDPVAAVKAWLDDAARSPEWTAGEQSRQQLSLF